MTICPIIVAFAAVTGQIRSAASLPTSRPVATSAPAVSLPNLPAVPEEEVLHGFLASVETNNSYDATARRFVRETYEKLPAAERRNFIQLALAVLSPDFKNALELAEGDQLLQTANAFEALSQSPDPYLACASANLAAAALIELNLLERCQNLITRVARDRDPVTRYTFHADQLEFSLGYCQVHTLQYEAALATLSDFLRRFPNAPERLRVTATHILTELSRRAPGRLGDVRDLMACAERRITIGQAGEPVTHPQNEAVRLLENLISEAEQQEKSQGAGAGASGQHSSKPGPKNPGQGARQSMLPQGPSQETNLSRTRARPGEAWGKMPPRQREEILQAIQKQFPTRYRELLEQYYKQLAKDAPPP